MNIFDKLDQKEKQRLRDFVSGFVAGVISVTVCNPLDIARTRLNVMSSPHHDNKKYTGFKHAISLIYKQEGIRGFYVGYKVNVKAIPIFHSLFFPIYEGMKDWCKRHNYPKWKQYLLSTTIAGGVCNILTNPIWVVRTRIMVQYLHPQSKHYKHDSITGIMKQMVKEEGFKCLFRGLSASILSISNAIIYFFVYENFKDQIHSKAHKQFTSYYVFLASILAKTIASTITYPFIVIRTILHDHRADQHPTMKSITKHIFQQKGINGFYAGLKPDLVRLLPSNTIVFLVYQYMKRKIPIQDNLSTKK